jgi:hypothetical protein
LKLNYAAKNIAALLVIHKFDQPSPRTSGHCTRRERPRGERAAEYRDELAPSHELPSERATI